MNSHFRAWIICANTLGLAACALNTAIVAGTACSTRGSSTDGLMLVTVEELEILLPISSRLVAVNTFDARHWAWDTKVGRVSVTWISKIARESWLHEQKINSCTLNAGGVTFFVETDGAGLTAVSTPIYEAGASLLVTIDKMQDIQQRLNGYRIVESIRIAKPGL